MKIEKITYIKHRKKKVAGKLNKTKITYNDLTIVLSGSAVVAGYVERNTSTALSCFCVSSAHDLGNLKFSSLSKEETGVIFFVFIADYFKRSIS